MSAGEIYSFGYQKVGDETEATNSRDPSDSRSLVGGRGLKDGLFSIPSCAWLSQRAPSHFDCVASSSPVRDETDIFKVKCNNNRKRSQKENGQVRGRRHVRAPLV